MQTTLKIMDEQWKYVYLMYFIERVRPYILYMKSENI